MGAFIVQVQLLLSVGRHNSGKTTLLVRVIAELVSRGFDIGSIKHHGHCDFDIDVPGKDSYRHRESRFSRCGCGFPDAHGAHHRTQP